MANPPGLASITPDFVCTIRCEPPNIFISGVAAFTTLVTVPASVTSLLASYQGCATVLVFAADVCALSGKADTHRTNDNAPGIANRHLIGPSPRIFFRTKTIVDF